MSESTTASLDMTTRHAVEASDLDDAKQRSEREELESQLRKKCEGMKFYAFDLDGSNGIALPEWMGKITGAIAWAAESSVGDSFRHSQGMIINVTGGDVLVT